ncbi:MAG TPA: peptidase S10 [Pirellulaceae bacterium]|nr:peptidase S10 [Pirellulaceae bacterium]HMP68339.1 peptidase S10 [Pirellulaceae bacterium]
MLEIAVTRKVVWLSLLQLLFIGGSFLGSLDGQEDRKDLSGDLSVPPHQIEWPTPVVTSHEVTIDGNAIPYYATAGTLPVFDEAGQQVADIFFVYYKRSDIQDTQRRPLTFSFNGGPGSASVWMHIGYTGPQLLMIDDEGFPIQPYGTKENPHSILDVSDIVYIDPVNTGFSRPVDGVDTSQFFGVNQDIKYLARWIEQFISRFERWGSPKILIGESYGTTRVAGLARQLQATHRIYVDGVILVSPTSLGIERAGPVQVALLLPHYAATAWYHHQLKSELQNRDLEEILPEVEDFAINEYLPALVNGGFIEDARRQQIAARVAEYAGVSTDFVLNYNLQFPIASWRKELLREQRLTVGRLDARYRGVDRDSGGAEYEYDPALAAWMQSFTPAINLYLRGSLNYKTERSYNIFGPVSPWDRTGDSTGENLRRSMAENPWLKVMIQAGYYDGGTDYFSAKYTMWNLDPSGTFRDRLRFHAYRSGHMMYLRKDDLPSSNQHVREFIEWAVPAAGSPARW